jgi:hypothetical protein
MKNKFTRWIGTAVAAFLQVKRTRWIGIVIFAGLLIFWAAPWRLLFGQATSGYTLLTSVTAPTVTYTDTTCPATSTCSYEVTAVDAQGQSIPGWTGTTAGSGSQSVSAVPGPKGNIVLTWVGPTTGTPPTSYDIYTAARVPNPPTGVVAAGQ